VNDPHHHRRRFCRTRPLAPEVPWPNWCWACVLGGRRRHRRPA